ncbi:MAG: FecR family protein [Pseudomonadota bacterium]
MIAPVKTNKQPRPAMLGLCLLLLSGGALAQAAGEVEFSRGVGFAQTPGQTPRTLGKGLPLREGDRLTTSDGASAIIKLEDGTRMTVRPNSELVLQQYKFAQNAPDNSMVMQLLRGGMRAVTGLIAKSSPNAARIQTNTATIGIRGTDFDARVCAKDCGTESSRIQERTRPNAVQASAKVVSTQGVLEAVDGGGTRRRLVDGGSVYPGDLVETASGTKAVLAFRDDSRVTLGGATRFRVDNFVYDDKNPGEGRFLVSLLRGSVRALTGLIGKANTRNVGFATSTATIGIRGTGLDLDCGDDGCSFFTWLGSIVVTPTGLTALQALEAGQGLFVGPAGIRALTGPTLQDLQRPDGVPVDTRQLFSSNDVPEDQEGLFVFVRDGHIEIATTREILHLGKGEAGFAGDNGGTARPNQIPKFLEFDRLPLPNSRNPMLASILGDSGINTGKVCN